MFRHEKILGLIWIQTVHQDFQTSTPETTGSNELPISYGDSFWWSNGFVENSSAGHMTKMAVMPIFGKKKASKNLTPHYKKDIQIWLRL